MRSRVLGGLAWKVTSQLFGQGARTVVAIVLARLLLPHDYGLAAMVLIFVALVPIFSDLALGAALVQRKVLSEDDKTTAFWTSAGVGLVFTGAGIALSWPLASFYGEPAVQPLFAALCSTFLLASLGTTQNALLNRKLDFRALELRMMAGTAAGAVAGIGLAVKGYGAWALIGQQIAQVFLSTLLLWVFSDWRPRFRFSVQSLRELGSFSGNVFGTRILFYLNRNIDNLLIGRFVGAAALGAYALAYNVMLSPMSRLSWPIQEVLFPAFARMQDDRERIASVWLRVNRLVGAITIPASLGLIAVAPEFVDVVLGARWRSATTVIQILAAVGLLQSLQSLNSSILQARDRTRTLLWYSVVALVASLIAFVGGLHWGIVGVATGYAISSSFVEPYYTWLTSRALGVPLARFAASLSGVVQASIGMLACVLVVKQLLVHADVAAGPRLGLLVLLGAVVYLPFMIWRAPEVLGDLKSLRPQRAGSGPQPEPQPTKP